MTAAVKVSRVARENALFELLDAVKAGREYPDAHTAICVKYSLSARAAAQLTKEYDAQDKRFK